MEVNGFEKRTQAKRQAIIDAARDLFSQRGFADVCVNDIAEKSGVSHVSIYNYFGDKNSLAVEALASYLDQAIKQYEDILEQDMPFARKLELLMSLKTEKIEEVGRSYFSTLAWSDKSFQEVYQEAAYVKAVPVYSRFIELGKKEGAIDTAIPTDAILAYIFQVLPMLQHKDYLRTSPDYKLGLFRLFFYGILGRE